MLHSKNWNNDDLKNYEFFKGNFLLIWKFANFYKFSKNILKLAISIYVSFDAVIVHIASRFVHLNIAQVLLENKRDVDQF